MTGEEFEEEGLHWIEKNENTSYSETAITVSARTDGNLYLYVTADGVSNISVLSGDDSKSYNIETPYIIDLGYYNAGDSITVSLDCAGLSTREVSVGFYAYSINKEILDLGYAQLERRAMEITEHTDTRLSGTVYSGGNNILYTSIPYDESWSVYVDGSKAETFEIGDCQLGIMLKQGEHTVEFVYRTRGLALGTGISAAALLCTAAVYLFKRKKAINDKIVKS